MGLSTLHISPLQGKEALPGLSEYFREHRAGLSRAEREYVTLAGGKSVTEVGRATFSPPEPELIVRVGGSLATVRTGLSGAPGGGDRGEVVGFSSASRRRLMRKIAALDRKRRPVFITLTYPDVFPTSHEKWKRDIDVFGKRLARAQPGVGFVWRIEFQERKSGSSEGRIAPHFHLLVYGGVFGEMLKWVPGAWWSVVGSGDQDHLKAGTRVERVHSWGGVMRYVGKYIAKENVYPSDWAGRAWGVVGRSGLPWAVEVVISISDIDATRLVRAARKMMGISGRAFSYGLTWIANVERVLDYLEYLIEFG